MDDKRFDAFSRVLGASGNRRGALKAAMAALVGGAGLAALAGDAEARPRICRDGGLYCTRGSQCCSGTCHIGKRVPKAKRNTCACSAGLTLCGKKCRDLNTDPNNCGACGARIDRETELCCDGVPTPIDSDNCQACGNVCGAAETCCGDGCADLENDSDNCGACGEVCEDGECVNGECSNGPAACRDFVPDVDNNVLVCAVKSNGDAVYGCMYEYFHADLLSGSYPCQSDSDCQDDSGLTVDCQDPDVTCYCEQGYWAGEGFDLSWEINEPFECNYIKKSGTCEDGGGTCAAFGESCIDIGCCDDGIFLKCPEGLDICVTCEDDADCVGVADGCNTIGDCICTLSGACVID
jgi:hypothetical protein